MPQTYQSTYYSCNVIYDTDSIIHITSPHKSRFTGIFTIPTSPQNKTPLSHKETKASILCGTTLFAGIPTGRSSREVTVTTGRAYWGKLRSAACSKGIFTRRASPPFHQNRRFSVQVKPDYSSLSTQFSYNDSILYANSGFVNCQFFHSLLPSVLLLLHFPNFLSE